MGELKDKAKYAHAYDNGASAGQFGFDFVHSRWGTKVTFRNKLRHNIDVNKELFVIHRAHYTVDLTVQCVSLPKLLVGQMVKRKG